MTAPNMLAHASHYARRGWPVFPLVVEGKAPATDHGFKDATTCLDQVQRWWESSPNCNIGIAVPPGYLVIDIDPRNGGNATARALSAELGPVPPTLIARTRAGGYHYWFKTRLDPDSIRSDLGAGVDVQRAGKGYVAVPPSMVDPGMYDWEKVRPVATLPPLWADRLTKTPRTRRESAKPETDPLVVRDAIWWECGVLSHSVEGSRNSDLFMAAVRLAERGCLTAEAEQHLAQIGTEIGLDPAEIDRALGNGRAAAEA